MRSANDCRFQKIRRFNSGFAVVSRSFLDPVDNVSIVSVGFLPRPTSELTFDLGIVVCQVVPYAYVTLSALRKVTVFSTVRCRGECFYACGLMRYG